MNESEFDRIAAVASEHWWYRTLAASVIHELPTQSDASLLDIGAGSGFMLREVRAARPRWRLRGIEPSAHGRAVAAREGIALDAGSYDDFGPHERERFDVILSLDSLYYLKTDARIAAAAARIAAHLTDDGVFVGQVVAFPSLRGNHDAWVDCERRFRGEELTRLFAEAGLVVRFRYRYQALAPLVFLSRRVLEPIRRAQVASDVSVPPAWVNHALERLVRVEDALGRRFPRLGRGYGSSVFWVARRAKPGLVVSDLRNRRG